MRVDEVAASLDDARNSCVLSCLFAYCGEICENSVLARNTNGIERKAHLPNHKPLTATISMSLTADHPERMNESHENSVE